MPRGRELIKLVLLLCLLLLVMVVHACRDLELSLHALPSLPPPSGPPPTDQQQQPPTLALGLLVNPSNRTVLWGEESRRRPLVLPLYYAGVRPGQRLRLEWQGRRDGGAPSRHARPPLTSKPLRPPIGASSRGQGWRAVQALLPPCLLPRWWWWAPTIVCGCSPSTSAGWTGRSSPSSPSHRPSAPRTSDSSNVCSTALRCFVRCI